MTTAPTQQLNDKEPHYNQRTLNTMEEARQISHNPDVRGYSNMDKLKEALNEYDEMKKNPGNYKRYSSFDALADDVLTEE